MSNRMRYQMVRGRVYRNMRAIQRQGKKETYLKGIGGGLVFLAFGGTIMVLNVQNVGAPSVAVALQQLSIWVWVIGGGMVLFGLYWIFRNVWMLVSFLKASERIEFDQ